MNANQALRGSKALGAVGLSLTLALTAGGRVQAAPVDLELTLTSTLTNVDDAEGRWQYDGGEVRLGGNLLGYYARKKRVSFGGTSPLNTAAVGWAGGENGADKLPHQAKNKGRVNQGPAFFVS